jgi:hypothetical protein
MQINVAPERIVEISPVLSPEEVRERALVRRVDAFGQVAKLFQRPKPEDIVITTTQLRFEPFWYAAATAHYAYDRRHTYRIEVPVEVQALTLHDRRYEVQGSRGRAVEVEAVDHCVEEQHVESFFDATRGQPADMLAYTLKPKRDIASVQVLEESGAVAVLPEVRSSFVVRKVTMSLMRTFQADRIDEERIDVEDVALFYRPVYAVEYAWPAKQKRQVLEFDGVTGEARAEPGKIVQRVAQVLENDTLFDIGADTVGTIVPGANIAVKLGRLAARKAIR